MGQLFLGALGAFGFTELQTWVVLVCLLVFLGNFLGGMLYSISRAYFGSITPRKLSMRISFRLYLLSELFLVAFAVYYHSVLIGYVRLAHIVFWLASMVIAPLLAVIGSQLMYLVLSQRIDKNVRAGKKRQTALKKSTGRSKSRSTKEHKNPAQEYLRGNRD